MAAEVEGSRAWRRWRQHVALLFIGAVVGGVVTAWDYAFPTECEGPLACIDYTGVATVAFWIVFGAQAVLSTGFMVAARRAKRPFFVAHVATACTLACGLFVAQGFAARRIADIRDRKRARTHFDFSVHDAVGEPR